MALRQIIEIDEELCDGCGDCVTACAEGAIQLIDGKAKLISDIYCDGLGACIGDCHVGAIKIIEREADGFDEEAVAIHLSKIGAAEEPPAAARPLNILNPIHVGGGGGCPGSRAQTLQPAPVVGRGELPVANSQLRHWPIQLHLVPPTAPFFQDADVLLAADCVPFAVPDFHSRYLAGRAVIVGCPKLDDLEHYADKLAVIYREAKPRSITVLKMEVPCCSGIASVALSARDAAAIDVPVRVETIGIRGGTAVERFPANRATA